MKSEEERVSNSKVWEATRKISMLTGTEHWDRKQFSDGDKGIRYAQHRKRLGARHAMLFSVFRYRDTAFDL